MNDIPTPTTQHIQEALSNPGMLNTMCEQMMNDPSQFNEILDNIRDTEPEIFDKVRSMLESEGKKHITPQMRKAARKLQKKGPPGKRPYAPDDPLRVICITAARKYKVKTVARGDIYGDCQKILTGEVIIRTYNNLAKGPLSDCTVKIMSNKDGWRNKKAERLCKERTYGEAIVIVEDRDLSIVDMETLERML